MDKQLSHTYWLGRSRLIVDRLGRTLDTIPRWRSMDDTHLVAQHLRLEVFNALNTWQHVDVKLSLEEVDDG